MKKIKTLIALFTLVAIGSPLHADSDLDTDHIDSRYYHTHEGSEHAHDLRMAMIEFEPDYISDKAAQLEGEWELFSFETTDGEMNELVSGGAFNIGLLVTGTYMQVLLVVKSNGKSYEDPPVNYIIENGLIELDNADFQAGLKGDYLVYTMLGMDEAYRYIFIKK